MANNLNILEVTLAEISDSTFGPNVAANFGAVPTAGVKTIRSWSYEPMVVRVTDHVANVVLEEDDPEKMALFLSCRHGNPWELTGHQPQKIIHPLAGVAAAPITTGTNYSVIYPDFDYATFD
jgi:hypothetical protein